MKTGGKNEKFAGGKSQLEISGGLPSSGADCKRLELISWRQNNNNKKDTKFQQEDRVRKKKLISKKKIDRCNHHNYSSR